MIFLANVCKKHFTNSEARIKLALFRRCFGCSLEKCVKILEGLQQQSALSEIDVWNLLGLLFCCETVLHPKDSKEIPDDAKDCLCSVVPELSASLVGLKNTTVAVPQPKSKEMWVKIGDSESVFEIKAFANKWFQAVFSNELKILYQMNLCSIAVDEFDNIQGLVGPHGCSPLTDVETEVWAESSGTKKIIEVSVTMQIKTVGQHRLCKQRHSLI